jgi:hypothetical protein
LAVDPETRQVTGLCNQVLHHRDTVPKNETLAQKRARESRESLLWIKGTSEAFDPLERNIEAFRTLDKVKELTVEYLGGKLPPGLDDALEAGVEAITDPSSDTYAAAKGSATLTVGGNKDTQTAENRVVYKREGKEDKAIVGGGGPSSCRYRR